MSDLGTRSHLMSDADVLAWSVVLNYRARQERDGITILLLPFPPCPACGAAVHEIGQVTLPRSVALNIRLTLKPCGHALETGDEYVRRLKAPIHELLSDVTSGYRGHTEEARSWTTEDIVRETRVRIGALTDKPPQVATNAEACPRAEQAEAAIVRVRAELARIRSITPTWWPVAGLIAAALDDPGRPKEQRMRPAHPDGTPYTYAEISAEGWGFCDACGMWSTGTPERPHQCAEGTAAALLQHSNLHNPSATEEVGDA